jgi:hypothetical protein
MASVSGGEDGRAPCHYRAKAGEMPPESRGGSPEALPSCTVRAAATAARTVSEAHVSGARFVGRCLDIDTRILIFSSNLLII